VLSFGSLIRHWKNHAQEIFPFSFLFLPLSVAAPEGTPIEGYEFWTPHRLRTSPSLSAKAATDPHHAAIEKLPDFKEYFLAHREGDGWPNGMNRSRCVRRQAARPRLLVERW
jgi:hypothetical protein